MWFSDGTFTFFLQETAQAMEKMREAVRRQDDELERLRKERKELQSREEEAARASEKYDQTVLNELQQEYQRLAQALIMKSFKTINLSRLLRLPFRRCHHH
jgi:uncharacterized membrane protein (DUF106 family)